MYNNKYRNRITAVAGALVLSLSSAALSAAPLVGQFLTGSTGGVYDVLGGGLANTINQNAEKVRLNPSNPPSVSVTPVQINNEKALFGIVQLDMVERATKGKGEYDEPQSNVRVVMGLYDNVMSQIVLEDSSLTNVNEASGLSIGVPSESTKLVVAAVYEMAGVPESEIEWVYLSYSEIAAALRDGHIDIGTITGYPKNGTLEGLASTVGVRFLEVEEDVKKKWNAQTPLNGFRTIPGGTYPGVEEDAAFYTVFASLIANKNTPEDDVYRIVKAIFENRDQVAAVHPAGKQVTPEKTREYLEAGILDPAILHPGAKKYFKEAGFKLEPNPGAEK
ncbi:TAXI family TRAP transporter solute-binding subunit [Marinobacter caseinilyticus]|uniref:TAXI family TRAP transporter solute-binding subunit n=1 Tax=Marinobacter caseinilyticus TaxID=2692195 RepID=UPI00140C8B97|nr:TAXI family TRAP transporter solute-binding subunit [Marinobacter caseinilyticus]